MKNQIVEMTKIVHEMECKILGDEKVYKIYTAMLNKQRMSDLNESDAYYRFQEPIQLLQCVESTLGILASVLVIIESLGNTKSDKEKISLFKKALSISLALSEEQMRRLVEILTHFLEDDNKDIEDEKDTEKNS